jgi:hypothetical protein
MINRAEAPICNTYITILARATTCMHCLISTYTYCRWPNHWDHPRHQPRPAHQYGHHRHPASTLSAMKSAYPQRLHLHNRHPTALSVRTMCSSVLATPTFRRSRASACPATSNRRHRPPAAQLHRNPVRTIWPLLSQLIGQL